MGRRSSARFGRAVWAWPDMLAAGGGAKLNRMCFFGHERNWGRPTTPRDRSDGAVCPSVAGKQLGSIRFELRSDANARFPCLIPDELSLPGSRAHTRLTSVSGAVHRKRSRDRADRAGSFRFPTANPISGGTIRRRILEQPAERGRPFPRNCIDKNELVFSTGRR
jgi:hypothetical protein